MNTQSKIERVAEELDLPVYIVRHVVNTHFSSIRHTIGYHTKTRITTRKFGTWRVRQGSLKEPLSFLIKSLRYYKKNDLKNYHKYSLVFKKLWAIKQDCIRYLKRKNAKYYPNEEQIQRQKKNKNQSWANDS